jgi:hypothetical protein
MTNPISDKKPLCGKIVKTYDNSRWPCLRPQGHEGGCNPFSDNPPLIDKPVRRGSQS